MQANALNLEETKTGRIPPVKHPDLVSQLQPGRIAGAFVINNTEKSHVIIVASEGP